MIAPFSPQHAHDVKVTMMSMLTAFILLREYVAGQAEEHGLAPGFVDGFGGFLAEGFRVHGDPLGVMVCWKQI